MEAERIWLGGAGYGPCLLDAGGVGKALPGTRKLCMAGFQFRDPRGIFAFTPALESRYLLRNAVKLPVKQFTPGRIWRCLCRLRFNFSQQGHPLVQIVQVLPRRG